MSKLNLYCCCISTWVGPSFETILMTSRPDNSMEHGPIMSNINLYCYYINTWVGSSFGTIPMTSRPDNSAEHGPIMSNLNLYYCCISTWVGLSFETIPMTSRSDNSAVQDLIDNCSLGQLKHKDLVASDRCSVWYKTLFLIISSTFEPYQKQTSISLLLPRI